MAKKMKKPLEIVEGFLGTGTSWNIAWVFPLLQKN